ncbi:MAG: serine/threonine protein kinase [Deltaproteobacteria bacterium]|nr:serine/threonine protein kinase [Deltaproteobacteria bacterium]
MRTAYAAAVRQVGPYLLNRRIGAGGMAEVWMAQKATLGTSKIVAVKLLAPNLASKPEYRRMFLDEARLSMLLNYSSIVHVFDAGEVDGECYIAMEWIDGVNLADLQHSLWEEGHKLPVEVAMYILGEVLRALDYAHNFSVDGAASIVHRDISPHNVMVSVAGEVKIMDFGVARFATEETSGLHVKGKLRYMPPEQLQGHSKDARIDVFAAGAVLHEMLDGRKFRGGAADDAQMVGMIVTGTTPPLAEPWLVPPPLETLRMGMLANDPRQRFASARDALHALAQCPGYRNAALELSGYVRHHRTKHPQPQPQQTWTSSVIQPMAMLPEAQASDTSVSRRALGANPSTGVGLMQGTGSRTAKRKRRRVVAALLLGAGGVFVGALGVGIAYKGLVEDKQGVDDEAIARAEAVDSPVAPVEAPEPKAAETPSEEPAPVEPPLAEQPPPEPQPEPAPVEEPVQFEEEEDEPILEEEPPPKPKPEVKPRATPKQPAVKQDPVEVEFVAGSFYFLYIKVKGKSMVLEPRASMKLPPGKNYVYIRKDPKDSWTKVPITLEPKRKHRVEFKPPKGAKVTFLN